MKSTFDILKTSVALAFVAAIGYGCNGDRPATDPVDDTSTSEAIVGMDSSAANLNNPRPAPIGDTSKTAEQADQFGDLPSNQDSAARALHKLDEQKQKAQQQQQKQNPKQ